MLHRTPVRLVLNMVAALAMACASSPPPQPAYAPQPAPQPMPMASTPSPAPQPPQPAADPAAQARARVVALLDQIETQLADCESHRMVHVHPQAHSIQDLVAQMAAPIASFPNAAAPYVQMQSHAARFVTACSRNDHHDMHEHHGHLRQFAAAIRAAL